MTRTSLSRTRKMSNGIDFVKGISPSRRSYKMPELPIKEFQGLNGAVTAIQYGKKPVDSELVLEFTNIPDDKASRFSRTTRRAGRSQLRKRQTVLGQPQQGVHHRTDGWCRQRKPGWRDDRKDRQPPVPLRRTTCYHQCFPWREQRDREVPRLFRRC